LVAGGNGGNTLAYSQDGITWTGRGTSVFKTTARFPGYSTYQNLWVATGTGGVGGNTLAYSKDGFTWTGLGSTIFGTSALFASYSTKQDLWVAGGQGGNTLAYSKDGFTWTGRGTSVFSTNTNYGIYSLSQDIWVAGGGGGNALAYSKDGYNWSGGINSDLTEAFSMAYGTMFDMWVATGTGSTQTNLTYSKDGYNWTSIVGAKIFDIFGRSIAYSISQDLWIAVGQNNNTLAYSKNGYNWTGRGTSLLAAGYTVTYSEYNKIWVAGGSGSNALAYSNDGYNWTGITGSTVFSGYSIGIAVNDVVLPIPEYVWLKFDTTTYTGSQTLVNASTSGAACNFWSANGSITNTTIGGKCALVTNTSASNSSGKWTITTDTTVLPVTAGSGYTIAYWMYIPSNGLPNGNGAECMLANYTENMNTATQGWISAYWAGNYVNGFGASVSSLVNWYISGAYNDSTYFPVSNPYGKWIHIGLSTSIGASNSTFNYYLNGVNRFTNTGASIPTASQTINFAIAANMTSINYADVRVYKRAVSGPEMAAIYNYGISLGLGCNISILIVGGGGGGSTGGGGAGGVAYTTSSMTFTGGTVISITIGAGGNGVNSGNSTLGNNGSDSSITYSSITIIAKGGGGGGYNGGQANDGGCGGGMGYGNVTTQTISTQSIYSGWTTYGSKGGVQTYTGIYPSAGGGGAGADGGNGSPNPITAGVGGIGIQNSITGSSQYYAGGGGGCVYQSTTITASGGLGGGGTGGGNTGQPGSVNTGGGGGGNQLATGTGGSGVIILSIPTASYTGTIGTPGTCTVTTSGLNKILTFTSGTNTYTC
jgi:hypothetical protein